MSIDTGSSALWVIGEKCGDTDPLCKDDSKFKPGKSSTFKDEDRELKLQYVKGYALVNVGSDDVFITDGLEAKKQLFGSASKLDTARIDNDGILGNNY